MEATGTVVQIERVRCLECGTKYVKTAGGGAMKRNPGCPHCGYVGWISTLVPPLATTSLGQRRFAGDPRPHSGARQR